MSKHRKRGTQVNQTDTNHPYSISPPKEFLKQYSKYSNLEIAPLFMKILTDVKTAALESNISSLEALEVCINYLITIKGSEILQNFCDNCNNPLRSTNLIILVCKSKCIKVLKYLFCSGYKTLIHLPHVSRKIAPEDEDEERHNAFYYAIRSNELQLLELLINKWPDNYFVKNSELLDRILAKTYEELKLKQVLLSETMDIFIANKLINLRFFSNSELTPNEASFDNISERIDFFLENVNLLCVEYKVSEVDEKFIFVSKFIVEMVHYLKQQLKCTYHVLPWEEIEFVLIAFIAAYQRNQEINFVYKSVLTKQKLLTYLETFAKHLKEMKRSLSTKETKKLIEFPNLKREEAVLKISGSSTIFAELCKNYKVIRDIHSMKTIHEYADLAVSADVKKIEGQLLIMRSLQVVGEHLKNTLGSPKLCDDTSELMFNLFPQNVKQIFSHIRNSFSHAYTLAKRSEIQRCVDVSYFTNIQNDLKNINILIKDILNDCKRKVVETQLKKLVVSETSEEIKEITEAFSSGNSFLLLSAEMTFESENDVFYMLQELIGRIKNTVIDKSLYDKEIFKEIDDLTDLETNNLNMKASYKMGMVVLTSLFINWKNKSFNENAISSLKNKAKEVLKTISVPRKNDFERIAPSLLEIYNTFSSNIDDKTRFQMQTILALVSRFVKLNLNNIKWIEELYCQININKYRKNGGYESDQEAGKSKPSDYLQERMQMLKDVLRNNLPSDDLCKDLQYCEKNKILPIIEMLLLDIMSILGDTFNCLTENRYFLEDNCPLLIGRSLRNHLAHGNALGDLFLVKPSRTVILNAVVFSTCCEIEKKKIGKIVQNESLFLKTKLEQNVTTLTHKKNLFQALEEGNFEVIKSCIKNGADINARGLDLQTALHSAAKGPSLDAVKFVVAQKIRFEKDVDGQSPLHVAVKYGRKCTVEYLIATTNANVNETDNFGKTCLHIAAQNGFLKIVQVLITNKANINAVDFNGITPLFYAAMNNHKDIVSLFVGNEKNIDTPKIMCGFTLLHIAAESGHLDLTEIFLRNGANVNMKTDQGAAPLHLAAVYGHLSVAEALISAGGNVNAQCNLGGPTPLHNAVEFGHQELVDIFLRSGACVNTYNSSKYTPLAYAAVGGNANIIESLLAQGAYVNSTTSDGLTPLHLAATKGHYNAVKVLLHHSALVNAKENYGYSVLHQSAQNGYSQIADLLIEFGANANIRANDNMTPLHLAVLNNKSDVVKKLLMVGAYVNSGNNKNMTPLHLSCQKGFIGQSKILIENGACINAQDSTNRTPLHYAVISGLWEDVEYLLTHKVKLHVQDKSGNTALHYAAHCGESRILNALISENVDINATNTENQTPLHLAVNGNHRETVQILLKEGAEANILDIGSRTPLNIAVKNNSKEIASFLISNNVQVRENDLKDAVCLGCTDIVMMLLKKHQQFDPNMMVDNMTLLCTAVISGFRTIVQILLSKGADVNVANTDGKFAPLHFAAVQGYKDIVQMLLYKNANVNVQSIEGFTPLHLAVIFDKVDIMQILINAEADVTLKDDKNRTGIELAVAHDKVNIVEKLAKCSIIDINAKGNDDFTLLHIAAQFGRLEISKLLLQCGADIYARNCSSSMPVHIAAREGHVEVVDFYLSGEVSIDVRGSANQTLLHYASVFGQIDMAKLLVEKMIEINASDANGVKPIHIACTFGFKEFVIFLLANGAHYNDTDNHFHTPGLMTQNTDIAAIYKSIGELFDGITNNNYENVRKSIIAGAVVNVKNTDNMTPLHYAVCRGHEKIVHVLLQNNADPNIVGKNGFAPLHYAAKFSHFNIVKLLLIHGAMYNVMNDSCKTPCDIAVNKKIIKLLEKINEVFNKVMNGNIKVLDDLRIIDDENMKVIIKCRDKRGKTLLVNAVHSDFPLIGSLETIIQGDIFVLISEAHELTMKEKYQEALRVYENILEKQICVLGSDNPCSLAIESEMAMIFYKQHNYSRALNILREVHEKQSGILGPDNKKTLITRGHIALTLHRQGNNEEALPILREVFSKQVEILGGNHLQVLSSQIHLGLVLTGLQKYEEALKINYEIFEKSRQVFGISDETTLSAYNNVAMVLSCQDKFDEAMNIYKVVYETRKCTLGQSHSVTLNTLRRMAQIHLKLQNYDDALEMLDNIFNAEKNILGLSNIVTLETWCQMADVLLVGKKNFQKSLEMYREILVHKRILLSPWHPDVLSVAEKINAIEMSYTLCGNFDFGTDVSLLEHAKQGVIAGDKKIVEDMLRHGLHVNQIDSEGRTLLHYAADRAHNFIVSFLLENHADCTLVSKKGNTPLHIASSKGYEDIVEILLQHVRMLCENKLQDFVNAKTFSSCSTALHVATNVNIVKALLKCGAMFNALNKKGRKPINISSDPAVISILKLLQLIFENVNAGNPRIIKTLLLMDCDMFSLISNTQNKEGKTLNQIAKSRNYHQISHALVEISHHHEMHVCNNNKNEYYSDMAFNGVHLIENKNTDDLCKFIVGEDSSDPFLILRKAERFMIHCQHIYDQAVKVYKKLLHPQVNNLEFKLLIIYAKLQELIRKDDGEDFGMCCDISESNLHNAASEGEEYVLKKFLAEGFDVNMRDDKGRTPLHYAASNAQNFITYYLLENGADCLLTSEKGNTALHIASCKGHGEIVEILLQHMKLVNRGKLHDFVNAKTSLGTTALHVAADFRIAMALLRYGAIYNVANNVGQLPFDLSKDKEIINMFMLLNKLFEGVCNGNPKVIDILSHLSPSKFAVIANARNHEGKTLSQLAIIKKNSNIACMLINTLKTCKNIQETRILKDFTANKYDAAFTDIHDQIDNIHIDLSNFHRTQLERIQELFIEHQNIYDMSVKGYEAVLKTLGLELNESNNVK